MTQHHDEEAAVSGILRAASHDYGDLPESVADRLDRVLDQLPAADTLHGSSTPAEPTWTERLRAGRIRYALLGGIAALLIVIGGVATAVQYVSDRPGDAADTAQEDGDRGPDGAAAPEPGDGDSQEFSGVQPEEAPTGAEEPDDAQESSSVETFATGRDYGLQDDLLAELRNLGNESTYVGPPAELQDLFDGGSAWQDCQDALAERYSGLLVAVDFARFEAEPAVVALLTSDAGDFAVAVTAACGDGVIDQLAMQG